MHSSDDAKPFKFIRCQSPDDIILVKPKDIKALMHAKGCHNHSIIAADIAFVSDLKALLNDCLSARGYLGIDDELNKRLIDSIGQLGGLY